MNISDKAKLVHLAKLYCGVGISMFKTAFVAG